MVLVRRRHGSSVGMVVVRYLVGIGMVFDWYGADMVMGRLSIGMVVVCYRYGVGIEFAWYLLGFGMVLVWYCYGIGLVLV